MACQRFPLDGFLIQLTDDQKWTRLDISRYLLSRYEDEPDFIKRIVNQDERWSVTSNQKPKNRACSGSTLAYPSEEIQEVAISREDNGFNFWNSQRVIMIDYLEQGRAINGTYYAGRLF
jgi:hypothetical protein